MRISDWSSDVCSSDLAGTAAAPAAVLAKAWSGDRKKARRGSKATDNCAVSLSGEKRSPAFSCHSSNAAFVSVARAKRFCRSEEHTSELQSLMRISYAVFCLQKKNAQLQDTTTHLYQSHMAEVLTR